MTYRIFRPPLPGIDRTVLEIERALNDQTLFGLPEFADDASATAAGLIAGQLYRTATGQLMVKL